MKNEAGSVSSSRQTVPGWLRCPGRPSAPPWSLSERVGPAGWDPEETSRGCTENQAPSPPSPPPRRRWLPGKHTRAVVYTERGGRRKICRCANDGRPGCRRRGRTLTVRLPRVGLRQTGPAFHRNLTQSHISPDVRAHGMHKSLYDPV